MTFVLSAIAAAALAQAAPAPMPAPTTVPVPPSTAATPAAASKYTLDTPIETLVADPKAKAVLTADLGGDVSVHPMYDSFKSMSLSQVAPMSQGMLSDDTLKKVAVDLAAIR